MAHCKGPNGFGSMSVRELLISNGFVFQPETDVYVKVDSLRDDWTHCYCEESPGQWWFAVETDCGDVIDQYRFVE